MSLQVGAFCYASPVEAGAAACGNFVPVSSLVDSGAAFRTVSCSSADAATGALNLRISTAPVDGSAATFTMVQQQVAFPNCRESDYYDAAEVILGAALGVWATWWGVMKIIHFLGWGRGDAV